MQSGQLIQVRWRTTRRKNQVISRAWVVSHSGGEGGAVLVPLPRS